LKEKLATVLKRKKAFDDSDDDHSTAKSDKKQSETAPVQPKTAPALSPKSPDAEVVKLEGQIATLQDGLGRIESSITKAVTASSSGFEDNIKSLMQKLDDVVIAMQSTQSDKNSPFNSPSLVQELPESVGLTRDDPKAQQLQQQQSAGSNESSGRDKSAKSIEESEQSSPFSSNTSEIAKAIQEIQEADIRAYKEEADKIKEMLRATPPQRLPLVSTRLQEFVKSCALLEIVDGDHKRLNYLYDIGILRTEDLETASRIIDLLDRYSPNLKPVDLAVIACSIEETAASDRETRKLLAIATALNKSK